LRVESLSGEEEVNGNYAFDAGVVPVFFESEGQGFLVSRHSILGNVSKGVSNYDLWGMRRYLLQSYSACRRKGVRGKKAERYEELLKQKYTCIKGIIAR
jgi:hypothetical protein